MDDDEFQKSFQMILAVATERGYVTRDALREMFDLTAIESSHVIRHVMQKHPELFSWDGASSSHRANLADLQKKQKT
jgi:hypothetical protein